MQHINLSWTIVNQTVPVDCDLYLIDETAGTSVDPENPSFNGHSALVTSEVTFCYR